MSIVSVKRVDDSGSVDEKFNRQYSITFLVVVDSAHDGTYTVGSAVGNSAYYSVPVIIGTPYFDENGVVDDTSLCRKITPKRGQGTDRFRWTVTCDFGTDSKDLARSKEAGSLPGGSGSGFTTPQTPLLRQPDVSWDGEEYQRPIQTATYLDETYDPPVRVLDSLIANTVGDTYDPPPTIDDVRQTVTISRNEATYDTDAASHYTNLVNTDYFAGYPPGMAKFKKITGALQWEGGIGYWRVTYVIQFRLEGWLLRKRNEGMFVFNDSGAKIKAYVGGQPSPIPVLIKRNGKIAAAGETPVVLQWEVYRTGAFAPLALPV